MMKTIRDIIIGLATTIIASLFVYVYNSKFINEHLTTFVIITLSIAIIFLTILLLYYNYRNKEIIVGVNFHSILSAEKVSKLIKNATEEIWTFQISGGHHTRNLTNDYKTWLAIDRKRKLKVLFLNPDNNEIVRAVGLLLGRVSVDYISDNNHSAFVEEIKQTLTTYTKLKNLFPDQVQIGLYDCCPPCSIFGCDLGSIDKDRRIMVVENYIYDLPWSKRPCYTLRHAQHKLLDTYIKSLENFFESSKKI